MLESDIYTEVIQRLVKEGALPPQFMGSHVDSFHREGGKLCLIVGVTEDLGRMADRFQPLLKAELTQSLKDDELKIIFTLSRAAAADTVGEGHASDRESLSAHQSRASPPLTSPSQNLGYIIAVASGKGGVGKSTIAVNLAVALANCGLSVGLLDADIYGPSLPRMLGHQQRPKVENGKIIPVEAWGLFAMSIGFLVEERQALMWRGPMVMGAIEQFLRDVAWPRLDVTVIDMPPGTGDAHLTIVKKLPVSEAVIVSTPQDIALIDAQRSIQFFKTVGVHISGIIENMAYFSCPSCHARAEPFGHGGARAEACKLEIPFIGEIPLLTAIRESGDQGHPFVHAEPLREDAVILTALARAIKARAEVKR